MSARPTTRSRLSIQRGGWKAGLALGGDHNDSPVDFTKETRAVTWLDHNAAGKAMMCGMDMMFWETCQEWVVRLEYPSDDGNGTQVMTLVQTPHKHIANETFNRAAASYAEKIAYWMLMRP